MYHSPINKDILAFNCIYRVIAVNFLVTDDLVLSTTAEGFSLPGVNWHRRLCMFLGLEAGNNGIFVSFNIKRRKISLDGHSCTSLWNAAVPHIGKKSVTF